jgi:hypothetical protein
MKNTFTSLLLFTLLLSCGAEQSKESTAAVSPENSTTTEEAPVDAAARTIPRATPSADLAKEEASGLVSKENDQIATIRANYARIQQQIEGAALKEDIKTFECKNDPGGGELIRYYDGKDLVAMSLNQGSEHSWEVKTVYFVKNEPFFVFEEKGYWQFGGPLNEDAPNTIDNIQETRYYLNEGEVIRQLVKDYEIKSWEKETESAKIPNENIAVPAGTKYPDMSALAAWRTGKVGC